MWDPRVATFFLGKEYFWLGLCSRLDLGPPDVVGLDSRLWLNSQLFKGLKELNHSSNVGRQGCV